MSTCQDPKTGKRDPNCPECAAQSPQSRLEAARKLLADAPPEVREAVQRLDEEAIARMKRRERGREPKHGARARKKKGTKPNLKPWSLRREG